MRLLQFGGRNKMVKTTLQDMSYFSREEQVNRCEEVVVFESFGLIRNTFLNY